MVWCPLTPPSYSSGMSTYKDWSGQEKVTSQPQSPNGPVDSPGAQVGGRVPEMEITDLLMTEVTCQQQGHQPNLL